MRKVLGTATFHGKMKKWKDSQLVPKKGILDTKYGPWLVGAGHC